MKKSFFFFFIALFAIPIAMNAQSNSVAVSVIYGQFTSSVAKSIYPTYLPMQISYGAVSKIVDYGVFFEFVSLSGTVKIQGTWSANDFSSDMKISTLGAYAHLHLGKVLYIPVQFGYVKYHETSSALDENVRIDGWSYAGGLGIQIPLGQNGFFLHAAGLYTGRSVNHQVTDGNYDTFTFGAGIAFHF